MNKPVRVDPEAEEEIAAGIDWYESKRLGLGSEFLDEISAAIRSLDEPGPECGPVNGVPPQLGIRRKLVKRFPYVIIFVELTRAVRVIAVAHGSRRPGYWRRRV
jgi:plasmid stabilization system protein ParE